MRKEKTLFILGILVSVLSFLGFPVSWRKTIFLIIGILIMYLAYLFYIEVKSRLAKDINNSKPFVDNLEKNI